MGFLDNLRRGLDAARNPPSQAEIEASLRHLTPEQRAAYDANMARVREAEAESQASWEQAAAINDDARVLGGEAGRYLYGAAVRDFGSPEEMQKRIAEVGVWQFQKEMREQRKGEFTDGLRQAFNRDLVEQIEDPAERERVAAAEREQRAQARAPYRAAGAAPVEITRIATRGATQLQELAAFLGSSGHAAHPERVFGVYRVPDRISQALTPHSEKGRVVEWDVVHLPGPPAGPATEPVVTSFAAHDRWVGRRLGEPSVLDEDVALAFCRGAGIGPEHCLGIARYSEFRELRGGNEDDPIRSIVRGVVVVHPAGDGGAYERMRAAAPIAVPHEPEGAWVETLDWSTIARAVRPKINHPPSVPSPFPYLPSSPQELLRSYLEVVGVQPHDCYAAAATVHSARALEQGGFFSTNLGPKQPCADGKERMRSHGCQQVVVAYRDTPAYAEGRGRWERYQAEVLQGRPARGPRARAVLQDTDAIDAAVPKGLRTIVRVAEKIDMLTEWEWGEEDLPPYRYCWPPVG